MKFQSITDLFSQPSQELAPAFVTAPAISAESPALVDESPALVDESRAITYGELNERANRIARFLLERDAGAGVTVGVLMPRSIDFALAATAIRRAGAAYLPLDPGYPASRLEWIAADAKLRLILTDGNVETVPGLAALCTSIHSDAIARMDSTSVGESRDSAETAYIIYTSGTTGTPKGVCITQANLNALIAWHRQAFAVTERDRAAPLSPVGFDAAVWDLWPYLASGAALYFPPEEIKRRPEALRDWLVEKRITLTFAPTPLAEQLIELPWPAETALRVLLTGGDRLRRYPPASLPFRLVNNYGPAECTVVATSGEVCPEDSKLRLPSIGKPIAGTFVTLLDENLEEVAPGAEGEICIGGAGVGLGYLNRPELTTQKFIERKGSQGIERLYRSGDFGRMHPDGSLQFLGRVDDQVKIRGYRVECGEVEAALNALQHVADCAVAALEDETGDHHLVAWLVVAGDAALARDELRRELLNRLPAHMVPGEFVQIAAIPRTDHGKLDRNRLPRPDAENRIPDDGPAASYIEEQVIAILKGQLGIQQIGRDDNFFLLGGHSFAAARVLTGIRGRFQVELSLRTIFDHPTPAGMAREIEERIAAKLREEGEVSDARDK